MLQANRTPGVRDCGRTVHECQPSQSEIAKVARQGLIFGVDENCILPRMSPVKSPRFAPTVVMGQEGMLPVSLCSKNNSSQRSYSLMQVPLSAIGSRRFFRTFHSTYRGPSCISAGKAACHGIRPRNHQKLNCISPHSLHLRKPVATELGLRRQRKSGAMGASLYLSG